MSNKGVCASCRRRHVIGQDTLQEGEQGSGVAEDPEPSSKQLRSFLPWAAETARQREGGQRSLHMQMAHTRSALRLARQVCSLACPLANQTSPRIQGQVGVLCVVSKASPPRLQVCMEEV